MFKNLDWAGFIADASAVVMFYLDNLKIGPNPAR
jgi:hypothetical protein